MTRNLMARSGFHQWVLRLLVGGALSVLVPQHAFAAEPPAARASADTSDGASTSKSRETVFSLAVKGGWLMIPIGLCSVVVLTWTIERLISLRRSKVLAPDVLDAVFETIPSRAQWSKSSALEAMALCDESDSIVSRVIKVGVEKVHRDEPHAQKFLEEAAAKELHVLKRKLRPFEVCVAVAPLLGLLGTIFGMISSFEKTTMVETAARADTLAGGIYQALVTTAAGLCVAIPALLLHHHFMGRVDRVQDAIEESSSEFLDHYYAGSMSSKQRIASGASDGRAKGSSGGVKTSGTPDDAAAVASGP
jgi:biopolymer transport protein ExbB